MRASRIVFYGNFGAGNLGNEVTLQTAIEQTLARVPGAELVCVCTNPDDVRTRHGIGAVHSMSRDSGWSWRDLDVTRAQAAGAGTTPPGGGPPAKRGFAAQLRRLGRIAFIRLPGELAHWYRMLWLMARSNVFLVPGTGIITDGSCGSLGWPYDMFKLSLLARLCRKHVVYLSVGAGPFERRLGSWLIRRSLALAHYRSYRDVDSKQRLEAIGFDTARDAVYPDLVFGLSGTHLKARNTKGCNGVVGLGLKDYATTFDADDPQDFRDYLAVMADFVMWLHARGYAVRLIIGDAQYDTRVREQLISLLASRGASVAAPQLRSDPVPNVDELIRQLDETDAVISPRFHNLVLALLLNKPVIALSDLPKVTALLVDLGLGRFCLSLESLKTVDLTDRFEQLQSEREKLRPEIASAVEKYRCSVDEQYAKVYSSITNYRGS